MGDDVRLKSHGLAPKSAADFAFLLHGFHFLKDEGVMALTYFEGIGSAAFAGKGVREGGGLFGSRFFVLGSWGEGF